MLWLPGYLATDTFPVIVMESTFFTISGQVSIANNHDPEIPT